MEAGFGVASLAAQLQGKDWSDPEEWPGPDGLLYAASVNQVLEKVVNKCTYRRLNSGKTILGEFVAGDHSNTGDKS